MAWPINARYQTFVANVTTITAAALNAFQDAIYHIVGGSRTLKKAAIDAVGNVDSSAIPSGQLAMDGKAAETTASISFVDATSAAGVGTGYNLRLQTNANSVGKARLYEIRGGWVETTNAYWTGNPGAEWARDVAADATMRRMMANDTGNICFGHYAINNPGATWAIADWTTILTAADDADIGDVGVGRDLIANRNLVAFTGGVSGATNVTAQAGDVVATIGNVTAGASVSAGTTVTGAIGVTATTGAVQATAGNLVALGTVVGSAGPGLVKARRIYGNGTAIVSGKFSLAASWGADSTVTSIVGTDHAVQFTINAIVGAGAMANPAVFTFTYADGTWTNAPVVNVALKYNTEAPTNDSVEWQVTPTAVTVTFNHLPVTTKSYEFVITSNGY